MVRIDHHFSDNPYSLPAREKQPWLTETLRGLSDHHREHCAPYRRILAALPEAGRKSGRLEDIPWLPVRLFKLHELCSVPREAVVKVLTSSGTTTQAVSRVFLDRETSMSQTKALVSIIKSFIGSKRRPMILVDSSAVIRDPKQTSARGAGLLGLSFFGRQHFYLLDEKMNVNWDGLAAFCAKHGGEKIILFGFTYMVRQYLYKPCVQRNRHPDLSKAVLFHSGGWKKLHEEAVDNRTFKADLHTQFGLREVHNFYGMAEQVGSIFMECEAGCLHTPDFADVLVRDPFTLEVLPFGQEGLVQVLSVLPGSYPGHSLLTEDLGTVLGEDDCSCGRKGKYFRIRGRLPAAEIRGCSDTHAYDRVVE